MSEIRRLQELSGIKPAGMPAQQDSDQFQDITRSAVGHTDNERQMLRKEMAQVGQEILEIARLLEGMPEDADFPHWWQARISRAIGDIESCKKYLAGTQMDED